MEFLNPWGWLGLASLPAIVALHFFRRRYQVLRVGTVAFWRQIRERDSPGRTPRPIRQNLSLWLQLVAAFLATLLLAAPQTKIAGGHKELILVLDSAYSMQARDAGGASVADRVRAEIVRRWQTRSAGRHASFTVVEHGLTPRLLSARGATRSDAEQALAGWRPQQPRAAWPVTIGLLQLWDLERCEVWVFSDRPAPDWKAVPAAEFNALGAPLANAAITDGARLRLPGRDRERVSATVQNFSERELVTGLTLRRDARVLRTWPVRIGPGEAHRFDAEIEASDDPCELTLPADALTVDNRLVLCAHAPAPLDVLFDFSDATLQSHWQRALQAVAAFRAVAPPPPGEPAVASLVLTDNPRWMAEQMSAGCVMLCASNPAAPMLYRAPFLTESAHPLLRGLDWSGCVLGIGGWAGDALEPQIPRVSARDRVVLGELPSRSGRRFVLHADLTRGNLARQPAFPVLAQNLVEIARGFQPGLRNPNLRMGEKIEYRPPPGATEVCLWQDRWRQCSPLAAPLRLPHGRFGLFRIGASSQRQEWLAVNLNDADTSDLRAAATSRYRTAPPAEAAGAVRVWHTEWMVGLMLTLLGVMFADWMLGRGRAGAARPVSPAGAK
jgi:hypothetical protein